MHQQGGEHHELRAAEVEQEPIPPRIYVASLSDYNDGRLHGAWIEAAIEDDELYEQVEAMLARSPMPRAEEWAIHDFEGFCGVQLHEYDTLETIGRIARGIAEHGPAFGAFVRLVGTEHAADDDRFEDAFLGHFASMADFARHVADDLGLEERLDRLTGELRPYVVIDYEAFARDLGHDTGEEDAPDGGVFVFDLRT